MEQFMQNGDDERTDCQKQAENAAYRADIRKNVRKSEHTSFLPGDISRESCILTTNLSAVAG
ncbi:MAG: hypothetical protein E7632_11115 [Ruminococcaceae bacterium]|nr:hypothetical protein [Oscillospiraceae bacterium]